MLAFFVFAQAAALRGTGQSAADAAALAAVREARDSIYEDFLTSVGGEGGDLAEIIAGGPLEVGSACGEAQRLASMNNATLVHCSPLSDRLGYSVTIETNDSVAQTVIPGTGNQTARAEATAVMEPLCDVQEGEAEDDFPELSCESDTWKIDPDSEISGFEPRDLFGIRLED
ncbi:hypothetical protein GCM10027160_52770 [Streptomyces calidiresistens]|uniref:Uncharacterized protein n=1 Tax=Streptomyces calidiresistens TaxID=1485586 RepID=A0A7W3T4E8_9ACTN|nr:hypothetical protein [Streptomyces calidiresistens]MBB0230764.1 hypothetical protein [Streptomyces calidiresistens]